MMNYIKYVTGNRSVVGSMSTLNVFQSKKKTSFQATNQRSIVPNRSIVSRPSTKLKRKPLDSLQEDGNTHQMNRTIKNKPNNSLLSLTSILSFTLYMENTSLDQLIVFQSKQHSNDTKQSTQQNEDNTILGIFNGDILKATQSEKKERKPLKYSSAEMPLLKYSDNLMCLLLQMILLQDIYCWPFQNEEEHAKSPSLSSQKTSLARLVKYSLNEYANVGHVEMFSLSIKHQNDFFDNSNNNCRALAGEKRHKRNDLPSGQAKSKVTGDDSQQGQPNTFSFTKDQQAMVVYYIFFQCLTFSLYYIRQAIDQLDTDIVTMIKPFSLYIIHCVCLLLFTYIKWIFKSHISVKDS